MKLARGLLGIFLVCFVLYLFFLPFHDVDEYRARQNFTKANLKMLHNAVLEFKADTGRFPTEEEGLQTLVENVPQWRQEGYLSFSELPVDGWGHEFIYRLSPENKHEFVIICWGADGKEGGSEFDKDLFSDQP